MPSVGLWKWTFRVGLTKVPEFFQDHLSHLLYIAYGAAAGDEFSEVED